MKMSVLLLSLIVLSCNGPNVCEPTASFEESLRKWLTAHTAEKQAISFRTVDDFPEKFFGDNGKCGNECVVQVKGGEIILKEYRFTASYISEHALEATRGEFFENPSRYPYFRVMNVPPSGCVVVIITEASEAARLKEVADDYFENRYYVNNE